MTLGERLQKARKLTNVAAADLGTWAGLSRGTVSMIENGSRPDPSGTTIAALAKALGTSTDWLLSGSGDEPTRDQVLAATDAAKASYDERKANDGGAAPAAE